MGLFQQSEGAAAVLMDNGVYRQVDVYTRNGFLYAKYGSGYVRLNHDGSTTKAKMRLDTLSYDEPMGIDPMGRLCDLASVPNAKPLPTEVTMKLLGVSSADLQG